VLSMPQPNFCGVAMAQMKCFSTKNRGASALRQRKYNFVRRFGLPENALGGHLAVTYRRCGKPTCHCASGAGHPMWTLAYSFEGAKHVEVLSEGLAVELAPLVKQGRELREALMEVLAINLQLLHLWRQEQRDHRSSRPRRRARATRRKHKSSL
jgi:hypothetical protein